MSKSIKKSVAAPRRPERKFGPFHNGIGIAVWLNRVETENGTAYFRSITFNPRRYLDNEDGKWKDAASFRPVDLATLEMALALCRQFIAATPLPGQPVEGDEHEELFPQNGELMDEAAT